MHEIPHDIVSQLSPLNNELKDNQLNIKRQGYWYISPEISSMEEGKLQEKCVSIIGIWDKNPIGSPPKKGRNLLLEPTCSVRGISKSPMSRKFLKIWPYHSYFSVSKHFCLRKTFGLKIKDRTQSEMQERDVKP
jgi:hypothetical protein